MELLLTDYQKLLDLADGKRPVWSMAELARCSAEYKLVTPTGNFLTTDGDRKAKRIRDAIKQLSAGVPLQTEREDRSADLQSERWFRAKIDDTLCWFNKHAIFTGIPPQTINHIRWSDEAVKVKRLKTELIPILNAETLIKVIPVALQRTAILGPETICFSPVSSLGKQNRPVIRIQSKYYDYILTKWPECSWWHLPKSQSPLMLVHAKGSSLRRGFVAAVMLVETDGWPSPSIDLVTVAVEEKQCPRNTTKQPSTNGTLPRPRGPHKRRKSHNENTTA
jgi:hypothetical protein